MWPQHVLNARQLSMKEHPEHLEVALNSKSGCHPHALLSSSQGCKAWVDRQASQKADKRVDGKRRCLAVFQELCA